MMQWMVSQLQHMWRDYEEFSEDEHLLFSQKITSTIVDGLTDALLCGLYEVQECLEQICALLNSITSHFLQINDKENSMSVCSEKSIARLLLVISSTRDLSKDPSCYSSIISNLVNIGLSMVTNNDVSSTCMKNVFTTILSYHNMVEGNFLEHQSQQCAEIALDCCLKYIFNDCFLAKKDNSSRSTGVDEISLVSWKGKRYKSAPIVLEMLKTITIDPRSAESVYKKLQDAKICFTLKAQHDVLHVILDFLMTNNNKTQAV
jgi:hypothetical protein